MDRYIKDGYEPILALLQTGAENGIHLKELCKFTGLEDRDLRKTIECMRRDGFVIVSGVDGYYFPSCIQELKAYRKREESRACSILISLQSALELEDVMSTEKDY